MGVWTCALSVITLAHGTGEFYSGIVLFAIFLVLAHDRVCAGSGRTPLCNDFFLIIVSLKASAQASVK